MAVTTPPSITPVPTPVPQRNDRSTFSNRVDAFVTWLINAMTEFGNVATNVESNATDAHTSALSASTSASTASTQAGLASTSASTATTQAGLATSAAVSAAASAATASSAVAFLDTNPVVKGSADATKQIRFEVDGLTTGTTRVITVPDKNGTLAMTSDITAGTLDGSFTTLVSGLTKGYKDNGAVGGAFYPVVVEGNSSVTTPTGAGLGFIYGTRPLCAIDGVRVLPGAHYGGDLVFRTNSYGESSSTFAALTERFRISEDGVTVNTPAPLGYGTGAGGTATQATSKATAVTLNKPCGMITMHNASLAAGASVMFTLNNTSISGYPDNLLVTPVALSSYRAEVVQISTGAATIRVTNVTAGALSDAFSINFAIIKGATA